MDYDTTIKKLIQILKFKSSDNLNQIEELWDAVSLASGAATCTTSPNSLTNSTNIIHTSCSSSSKLDELELEFVNHDSTSSTSSTTHESTTSNNTTTTNSNSLKRTQSIKNNTTQKSKKPKISSPTQYDTYSSNNDSMDCQPSSQINNIDEYVIEMGLTCDTCK
jgi:hypothetical protein